MVKVSGFSGLEANVHDFLAVKDGQSSSRNGHVAHRPVLIDGHRKTPEKQNFVNNNYL
jgi:hypothetical protein